MRDNHPIEIHPIDIDTDRLAAAQRVLQPLAFEDALFDLDDAPPAVATPPAPLVEGASGSDDHGNFTVVRINGSWLKKEYLRQPPVAYDADKAARRRPAAAPDRDRAKKVLGNGRRGRAPANGYGEEFIERVHNHALESDGAELNREFGVGDC